MQTTFTPLDPENFRWTPWKNGGGITVDIADAYKPGVEIGSWDGMIWRLGRTAIVKPGPFSDLTGFERLQLVIAGSGLVLETPAGEIDLRQPFRPVRYDGGMPIVTRLESGPVEVVNLIADPTLCQIDLSAALPETELALKLGAHIVYSPSSEFTGVVDEQAVSVASGHALRIETRAPATLRTRSGMAIVASIRMLA